MSTTMSPWFASSTNSIPSPAPGVLPGAYWTSLKTMPVRREDGVAPSRRCVHATSLVWVVLPSAENSARVPAHAFWLVATKPSCASGPGSRNTDAIRVQSVPSGLANVVTNVPSRRMRSHVVGGAEGNPPGQEARLGVPPAVGRVSAKQPAMGLDAYTAANAAVAWVDARSIRPARTNGFDTRKSSTRTCTSKSFVHTTPANTAWSAAAATIPRPWLRSSHASGARRTTASPGPPPNAGTKSRGRASWPAAGTQDSTHASTPPSRARSRGKRGDSMTVRRHWKHFRGRMPTLPSARAHGA